MSGLVDLEIFYAAGVSRRSHQQSRQDEDVDEVGTSAFIGPDPLLPFRGSARGGYRSVSGQAAFEMLARPPPLPPRDDALWLAESRQDERSADRPCHRCRASGGYAVTRRSIGAPIVGGPKIAINVMIPTSAIPQQFITPNVSNRTLCCASCGGRKKTGLSAGSLLDDCYDTTFFCQNSRPG